MKMVITSCTHQQQNFLKYFSTISLFLSPQYIPITIRAVSKIQQNTDKPTIAPVITNVKAFSVKL